MAKLDEILEHQTKERAFLGTPVGKAFQRFKLAHSRYWQAFGREDVSDKRLRELDAAALTAERELRILIKPLGAYPKK